MAAIEKKTKRYPTDLTARNLQLARDLLDRFLLDQMLSPDPANRLHNQHPLPPARTPKRAGLHLIVDSTGPKLRGAGEWLFEKHGSPKRRSWKKLHLGIDVGSGEIVTFDL